jgi:hypothetical protein
MVKAAVSAKRFRATKHGAPADPVNGITADAMCPLLAIVDIGVDKFCLDIEDKTRLESANNRGVGYDLSNNLHQAKSNSASSEQRFAFHGHCHCTGAASNLGKSS